MTDITPIQQPYEEIVKLLDKVKKRQKICKKHINDNIDKILNFLQESNKQIQNVDEKQFNNVEDQKKIINKQIFQNLHQKLSEIKPFKNVQQSHVEYFQYISKLGKNIDKTFNKEVNNFFDNDVEFDKEILKSLISNHLIRNGNFQIEEILTEETGSKIESKLKETFEKLYEVLLEIKKKNLQPAIQWAMRNYQRLVKIDSNLLFKMHKLQFITIFKKDGVQAAIAYAKQNFQNFYQSNQDEIQKLMTSILYKDNLQNSQYANLYDDQYWNVIEQLMINETCRLLNILPQSGLQCTVNAGTLAMPKFLKLQAILNKKEAWKSTQELPIEIEIGKQFKFHSVFVCPVSKEINTPENPPLILKCGHVISMHSAKKMAASKTKFKCPYCPQECNIETSKKICF